MQGNSSMPQNYEIILKDSENVQIIIIKGYFNDEAGKEILMKARSALNCGKINLAIDFKDCIAINSQGIASLMDLAMQVIDDFKGKLVCSSLSKLNRNVLTIAGVIPIVQTSESLEDSMKLISG